MFLTLDDLPATPQTILVRSDFNMPEEIAPNQSFARLERSLPTLKELLRKGHRLIILSHYGRPKGTVVPELSLRKLIPILSQKLGLSVAFAENFEALQSLKNERVVLFENLRFFGGEEKNDVAFAQKLSSFGTIFVNDAFAVCHRDHASLVGIPRFLKTYAGRLLEEELRALQGLLNNPKKPMMAIIGGAKISSKIGVLEALLPKIDGLFIGGAMANTFLKAKGLEVGESLVEDDFLSLAKDIMTRTPKLYVPDTVIVERGGIAVEVAVENVQKTDRIMDVAPAFIHKMEKPFLHYETFLWNGPMGVFEKPPYDAGTLALTQLLSTLHDHQQKIVIAGGGDSVEAIERTGLQKSFSYISTGGGAFLEFLEGKTLPGIAALTQ